MTQSSPSVLVCVTLYKDDDYDDDDDGVEGRAENVWAWLPNEKVFNLT